MTENKSLEFPFTVTIKKKTGFDNIKCQKKCK